MRLFLTGFLCFALLPTAWAESDYINAPRAKAFIERMVKQHGFSRQQVIDTLDEAERIDALIPKETGNAEKVKPWYEYRKSFVHPYRIKLGKAFLREYASSFARAEKEFGVPREIIAGILGVETNYGRHTGNIRVLDALATQGFDHPTRADFFLSELENYLVLCRELGFVPDDKTGSYAGAMGLAQFMPSNYRTLALDYDHNGKLDLWSPIDAIGSIANYLVHYRGANHTWNRGMPVVYKVTVDAAKVKPLPRNSKSAELTVGVLERQGIAIPASSPPLPPETLAGLLQLEQPRGDEYWVALDNFYAIMSYNPRVKYAMAVYQLSQALREP